MNKHDLETLRRFIDHAITSGWIPSNRSLQGTFVVLDPPCVRISVASPSKLVDDDIYMDWISPLHDTALAKAAWGSSLIKGAFEFQEAWRYHQHKLLDLLQTAPKAAYFEYLDVSTQ